MQNESDSCRDYSTPESPFFDVHKVELSLRPIIRSHNAFEYLRCQSSHRAIYSGVGRPSHESGHCDQSSVISHQSSVIIHHSSVISHQSSVIIHHSSVVSHQFGTAPVLGVGCAGYAGYARCGMCGCGAWSRRAVLVRIFGE